MAIQQTLQFGVVLAIAVRLGFATAAGIHDRVGPHIANDAEVHFVARGHSARLDCDLDTFWQRASLSPAAQQTAGVVEARWLLNGAPLSKEDGRWKLYKNGTLVVRKLGKRLNGGAAIAATNAEEVYQCLAENQRYGAVLTKTINLRIAYLKEFLQQPDDIEAFEGQPIIIPCSIISLPKANVQWERDDDPLPQNTRYVPLPSGSLLITNVHSSDAGSYRCKAVNTILKKNKKSKFGTLTVLPTTHGDGGGFEPPTWIIPLDVQSNITAVVGDDVTLYCVANGTRVLNTRWLKDNDVVISNNSVLTIKNITRLDGGTYTCSIFASDGNLKKIYHVNVHQAPVFNSTPSFGVYVLARNIRLNCTATGWPTPEIIWYKNGKVFDVQSHIRARQEDWGLFISSPTASDSGIYQCQAYNRAGSAWTGAAVSFNSSTNSPSEPWDIKCLPYEAESVCLRWRAEPNVVAYTITAHRTGVDSEPYRDFLGNESFKFVENLQANSQYIFLIRTFVKQPSTEFANVTCNTGIRGKRNLTLKLNTPSSVTLLWEAMSNDFNPCNESVNYYQVQWKKSTSDGANSIDIIGFEADITGLTPGEMYEFRIKSLNSSRPADILKYSMPEIDRNRSNELITKLGDANQLDSIYNETIESVATEPLQLLGYVLSASSINVSWTDVNPPGTTYTLCYIQQDLQPHKTCANHGKLIEDNFDEKSTRLDNLKPGTDYVVRVQAHFGEQSSMFSHSLLISTPSDVPSEVQAIDYKVLSRTSVCVKWKPPAQSNGRIMKYSVRHTSDLLLPIDSWIASSILMPLSTDGCWDYDTEDEFVVSTVLHDLNPDLVYYVNVVAVNDAGNGNAAKTLPIITKYLPHKGFEPDFEGEQTNQSDIYYKQGVGLAIGIGFAFLGILACFGAFVVFKYLKGRLMSQRRFAPNGGPYSSSTTRPKQANGGQHCHNAHELQQLVETNGIGHLPPLPATIVDAKGGAEYSNGIYMNGHATNLRITENPQYYKKGINRMNEMTTLNGGGDREYEEDSNSNLQKVTKSPCYLNGNGKLKTNGVDSMNSTLNSTQTTVLLDDSISSSSLPRQPTLEPNG